VDFGAGRMVGFPAISGAAGGPVTFKRHHDPDCVKPISKITRGDILLLAMAPAEQIRATMSNPTNTSTQRAHYEGKNTKQTSARAARPIL